VKVQITGAQQVSPEQLRRLGGTAERAVDFFEQNFGPAAGPVKIDLDPETLSTGYDLERDSIGFPKAGNLINRGLDSEDVIDHEIFHALVARRFPHTSTTEAMASQDGSRLHEGLADFFAYKLNPDQHFGENYRSDKPYLRDYDNELSISLSPGSHAQGNAITAHLLHSGVELAQVREFLQAGDFSLKALQEVSPRLKADLQRDEAFGVEQLSNYPNSALKRYRIEPGRPLQLDFRPNSALLQAHPDFRVAWSTMEGLPSREFVIRSQDQRRFEVAATPQSRPEKLLAVFFDGQSQIGCQPYYLSAARESPVG
jgi:hypothetical protein